MPIIPNICQPPTPRDGLIIEVMMALDHATGDDEEVSTHELAEQIVELFEEWQGHQRPRIRVRAISSPGIPAHLMMGS